MRGPLLDLLAKLHLEEIERFLGGREANQLTPMMRRLLLRDFRQLVEQRLSAFELDADPIKAERGEAFEKIERGYRLAAIAVRKGADMEIVRRHFLDQVRDALTPTLF